MAYTDKTCKEFIYSVASKEPIPGGGSVAALVGALGASLSAMVAELTVGKKKYIGVAAEMEKNIEEIMIMGGGYLINNTPSPMAEYNVWVDPEAAEVMMFYAEKYGVKVTWVPLDATHECWMSKADADEMRKIGSPIADAMADFVEQRAVGYAKDADMKALGASPVHDALAVIALLNPDVLVDVRHVNVHIHIGGGYCDGMTCLDMRELIDKPAPNCYFALHANREIFCEEMMRILKNNTVYSK